MIQDIQDDPLKKIDAVSYLSNKDSEVLPKVDSGISSIEKSKAIKPDITPPMEAPILTAPSNQECVAFAVASLDATGRPVTDTVYSFVLKGEEVKSSVLEGWTKNLREIEEYIRQLLASPVYQKLQEIYRKGDALSEPLSGVQGVSSKTPQSSESIELLSTLDRLQVLEKVPPSVAISEASAPQDSSQVLVLPLTSALLAVGGFAIGTEAIHSVDSIGIIEMVQQLQPLFPSVAIQDVVILINLMVAGPIYFTSWNEAINKLKNREQQSNLPLIQNFAKDVIKIVTDPQDFIKNILIQQMKGTQHLSSKERDRLASILKFVLIGVALSLLYSAEVGKVQNKTFGGIEPEELKELLLGNFSDLPDSNKKMSTQEQLTRTLIHQAWTQLQPLSIEDRSTAVNILLSYVAKAQDLDPMLNPAKVFDEAMAANHFNHRDKIGIVKG